MTAAAKVSLLSHAARLGEIAVALGLDPLAKEILADTDRRLDESKIRALVIGEIKQGKSTLINALVGQDVLPMGVTPTTGAVVIVRLGDDPAPYLVRETDSAREHAQRERLEDTRFRRLAKGPVAGEQPAPQDRGQLEVVVPSGRIPEGLELVDTPGINDIAAFRTAMSRGELPGADILVLVLDATQLLNRTEMAFLRDAVAAVGGLQDSGARLLVAVNRIDLIAERERPKLEQHLRRELDALWKQHASNDASYEVFMTDARTALRDPKSTTPGVQGVDDLRRALEHWTESRAAILPLRARSSLLRYGALLGHNAAVAAHALRLELDILRREIRSAEAELSRTDVDMTRLRALMAEEKAVIARQSAERTEEFREQLQKSVTACIDAASQRTLAAHLAGSVHDAFVVFAHRESERLRASLDALTRKVIHTHSEQARRRLFHATMRLGFRGPTIYINPPSLALEASLVVVGVVGTGVMYFGNFVAGMLMTVAGPLTTVVLREKSLRDARVSAKAEIPTAMQNAAQALASQIDRVIDSHLAALDEHLTLANTALGEQLMGVLRQAESQLAQASAEEGGQAARQHALALLEHEIAAIRTALTSLGTNPDEPV